MHPAASCFAQLHAAMKRLQLCRETSEAERRRRGNTIGVFSGGLPEEMEEVLR
jgi:hypothetical protein